MVATDDKPSDIPYMVATDDKPSDIPYLTATATADGKPPSILHLRAITDNKLASIPP
jgi:hypothetical protein